LDSLSVQAARPRAHDRLRRLASPLSGPSRWDFASSLPPDARPTLAADARRAIGIRRADPANGKAPAKCAGDPEPRQGRRHHRAATTVCAMNFTRFAPVSGTAVRSSPHFPPPEPRS
jgi:hypothetical protein